MATPLKLFFDARVVDAVADAFTRAWPGFPRERFVRESLDGLDSLELLPRGHHLAAALARALPPHWPEAARIVRDSLGPPLGVEESWGMAPFFYLPHVFLVAKHGLGHWEESMALQEELTRRFSCEFSIRPYLEREPERTLARLHTWTRHPDVHVRRLVSEGTRPRLPWAPRLRRFQEDPRPVLALLEELKDDPALYVRRSVANNLNDIGKDHPEVLREVAERWSRGASPERAWVVKHALRSAVKRGEAGALRVMGASEAVDVAVSGAVRPEAVAVGGAVRVRIEVRNRGAAPAELVVDYALRPPSGAAGKVFKGARLRLGPGEAGAVERSLSFKPMSTRRHHPGVYRIEALVNGRPTEVARLTVEG